MNNRWYVLVFPLVDPNGPNCRTTQCFDEAEAMKLGREASTSPSCLYAEVYRVNRLRRSKTFHRFLLGKSVPF